MFKPKWEIKDKEDHFELRRKKWYELKYRMISCHTTSNSALHALTDHLKKEGKLK